MLLVNKKLLGLLAESLIFVCLVNGRDVEHAVLRNDVLGAVEVQGIIGIVVLVERCPAGIVTVGKAAPVNLELVRHDKAILPIISRGVGFSSMETLFRVGVHPVRAGEVDKSCSGEDMIQADHGRMIDRQGKEGRSHESKGIDFRFRRSTLRPLAPLSSRNIGMMSRIDDVSNQFSRIKPTKV